MAKYLKPVPPKKGYRRGFEPRPGESDSERLKREMEELKRRQENKKRYGATYENYPDQDIYAVGGAIDKPKSRIRPLPTRPGRVPPSLLPTKPPSKDGVIKKYAKGGSAASKRGDGCATKGKTKGRMV